MMKAVSVEIRRFLLTLLLIWGLTLLLPGNPAFLVDNGLTIVFLDVGQGDAIYLESPDGCQVLVDGGGSDDILSSLSQVMPVGDRTLDIIMLTHPHSDHIDGLLAVLKNYDVAKVVVSTPEHSSAVFHYFQQLVVAEKAEFLTARQGDRFVLGPDLFIEVLWPSVGLSSSLLSGQPGTVLGESVSKNANLLSLVLKLDYLDFEVLLLGDAEVSVQQELLTSPQLEDVEVFKVAHHGSKNGLNQAFLAKANPELAVVSVGKNSYGLPAPSVMSYLQSHVRKVFRTDENGDIKVVSDGHSWSVIPLGSNRIP